MPGTGAGVTLRTLRAGDLERTVALHDRTLGQGLFPTLGSRFLLAYHETFASSPHAVALVAVRDDQVCGMLLGTTAHGAHHRWVVRSRGRRLALIGAAAMVRRPRVAWRFVRSRLVPYVRTLWRLAAGRRPAPAPPDQTDRPDPAVLSHVAVSGESRGHGVGRRLVDAYLERAKAAGAREALVVTASGGGAEGFYRATGWAADDVRRNRDGVLMASFRRPLDAASGD